MDPGLVLCVGLIMPCRSSGSCHDAAYNGFLFWLSGKVVALHLFVG